MVLVKGKFRGNAKSLVHLIAECEVDTGNSDLAAQHDHYLYTNKNKKYLTEDEVDNSVIGQADNNDAWENLFTLIRKAVKSDSFSYFNL